MIFQLVYTSTALTLIGGASDHDILNTSLFNNAERHITGFLLRQQDRYMQLIEGEESEVRALFAAIEADPRHCDVTLSGTSLRPMRSFPEWSMGFRALTSPPLEEPMLLTRSPHQRCELLADFLFAVAWSEPADTGVKTAAHP